MDDNEAHDNEANAARVLELLARHRVVSLASCGPDGAWASAVFYANAGFDLYFVSSPASRHCANLAFDRRIAGAIHPEPGDWRSIVGLQVGGVGERLRGDEAAAARAVYERKFPFAGAGASDAELVAALSKAAWYRFRLDRAEVIDNSRGLGCRSLWRRGLR